MFLTALVCAYCRAAERRDDMVGLLHTKGYSRVIDLTGEEKNGRRVSQHLRTKADHPIAPPSHAYCASEHQQHAA